MTNLFRSYKSSFQGLSREVWYLSLVTLINRAGTMVIPFLAIYLTDQLDFTYGQVGWIMTAFGAGSMAGAWIGGRLTDWIGYYTVMIGSLVGTGILFIFLQFVQGFWPFCACIFTIMIIADSFRPAGLVAINAYSKPSNRTRSVTLIRLAINLGFSFGPALGGWLIVSAGYAGLFWIDGLSCLAAAMIILALLNPRNVKVQAFSQSEDTTTTQSPYSDRPYWLFLAICFLLGFSFMQLFSTVPLYYRESLGLSENVIGLLLALNGVIIFLTEMPLVNYFERGWSKLKVIQVACVLVGGSFIILNLSGAMAILVFSMVLITIGEMLGFPFTNALAMNRAPEQASGQYLALYSMSFSAAHIFGPNIGMQLADQFGFAFCWYVMGGVAFAAIILARRLERTG